MRVLALRNQAPALFSDGAYLPLAVTGPMAKHVVAFARRWQGLCAVVAFCLFTTKLTAAGAARALPFLRCTNTRIHMPAELQGIFSDAFTSGRTFSLQTEIEASQVLQDLPIALLTNIER
jgi:(1->4)-alpha-D-glucan 1-alpha-D-glucosylmutase